VAIGAKPIESPLKRDKDFPMLEYFDVSLQDDFFVNALQRDLSKLAKDVHGCSALKMQNSNDSSTSFIRVPRTQRMGTFLKRAKKTKWVHSLLDAMLPQTTFYEDHELDVDVGDELGVTRNDAARWLIYVLGRDFADEFVIAAEKLSMPCHSRAKFDAEETQALFKDCNLGTQTQKLLRQHLRDKLGSQLLASDCKIKKLGDGAVPPETSRVVIDQNTTIDYYTKPMDKVIKNKIIEVLDIVPEECKNKLHLQIAIGGDHGKGAFQEGMELLLTNQDDGTEYWREVVRLAEVECKKDTSDVLKKTVIKSLNEALDRMLEVAVCTGETDDGCLRIFCERNSTENIEEGKGTNDVSLCTYASFGPTPTNPDDKLVCEIDFRIMIVGDLALYAMLLGKEDNSNRSCWLCKLLPAEWQKKALTGELWTMEDLIAAAGDDLEALVKEHPLLRRIGPDRFGIPLLHLLLGVANDLLTNFLTFVDARDGLGLNVTGQLKDAYTKEWKALDTYNDMKEALTLFGLIKGGEMAELRLTRCQLNEWMRQTVEFSLADRREMGKEKTEIAKKIKEIEGEKKKLDKEHEKAKLELNMAKQSRVGIQDELQEQQTSEGWVPTPLRVRIEKEALKPFLIENAAYWGKLVGNGCRRLFGNATAIFNIIRNILEEEGERKNMDAVGMENVKVRCRVTRDAMILFDGFFSLLQETATKVMSESELKTKLTLAGRYVAGAMQLWRSLQMSVTPKAHACETHAVQKIKTTEEWVERLHQEHLRDKVRVRSMRDKAKKFSHISRWEQANRSPKIKQLVIDIHERRSLTKETKEKRAQTAKRKRQEKSGEDKEENKRMRTEEERKKIRSDTLETYINPDNKLPTALQENVRESRLV
jgi:hypothetical protein